MAIKDLTAPSLEQQWVNKLLEKPRDTQQPGNQTKQPQVEPHGQPAHSPSMKSVFEDKKQDVSREFVDKSTSPQVHKETSQQVDKSTNLQVHKSTKKQVNKSLKRFTTYLTEESIRTMKRLAFDIDQKDYEVFQEAVDVYLRKKGY